MDTTLDDLQNGYFIYQSREGFRFGIDAVLLSGFARIKTGDSILDLGTGNGILPILLAAKTKQTKITGLELQPEAASLAGKSVEYNGLADRIRIVEGDIRNAGDMFGDSSFNAVVSNPPYIADSKGEINLQPEKAMARHEVCCTLADVAREASKVLKSKGRFFMVHRPDRLAEIIKTLMDNALMPKRLRIAYPYADKAPVLIFIEAVKHASSGMIMEKPFIIYDKPGIYTAEVLEIYGIKK